MEKRLKKWLLVMLTVLTVIAALGVMACCFVAAINSSPWHLEWVRLVMHSDLPGWVKEFLWGWW